MEIDPPSETIFIDPVTPGVSYITACGAYFSPTNVSPVPEPAALTLLGLGLVAQRRRQSPLS